MTDEVDDETWPKRFSLLDRAGLTFKSFLASEFGGRFYQEKFLDGIAARRIEVHARMGKASASCFLSATLLAFFDLISGTVTYGGLEVRVSQDLVPVIAFVTSAALLNTSMAYLDDLLMNRYISVLGQNIGIYSFSTFLIDKVAINVWADAVVPKYFGERSRWGHKAAMTALLIIMILILLTLLSYPTFFVVKSIIDVWSDESSRTASLFLSALSGMLLIISATLIFCFTVKFKFDRANFNEHDLEPTPEFRAEIETELAKEVQNQSR